MQMSQYSVILVSFLILTLGIVSISKVKGYIAWLIVIYTIKVSPNNQAIAWSKEDLPCGPEKKQQAWQVTHITAVIYEQ